MNASYLLELKHRACWSKDELWSEGNLQARNTAEDKVKDIFTVRNIRGVVYDGDGYEHRAVLCTSLDCTTSLDRL